LLEIGSGKHRAVPKKVVASGVDPLVDRIERGGRGMKRIRFIILLSAMAVAMVVPVVAKATGSTGTTNSVTIQQYADYEAAGFMLDVGLYVRCKGNGSEAQNGLVSVQVNQSPPQTPYPVGFGSGPQPVVCDGTYHAVGVTIVGEGFDAGLAKATATLTPGLGGGGSVTTVKWITIVVV
jgi:hypothetical protein